jgi:hypothetical protein
MAIINISSQYKYTGKGPFDAKSTVRTYAELLSLSTWQVTDGPNTVITAYNGMIVAVWLNKADTSRNGLYFLYDPKVTSVLVSPDVTDEANWHKLVEIEDLAEKLSDIDESFKDIYARLDTLENQATAENQITFAEYTQFPSVGEANKLYVALDKRSTFIWSGDSYVKIGGDSADINIKLINGGTALDQL